MQINEKFWKYMQRFVDESEIVIDRPKGSRHPKFPKYVYAVDYGYLKNTKSADGIEIDVYLGSDGTRKVIAVAVTVDFIKRDSEIKILVGCTDEEIEKIQSHHFGNSETFAGIIIKKGKM